MSDEQYVFESEIHDPKTWVVVGTVNSKYLTDENGNSVINKATGSPYIVPLNYDPYKTIEHFRSISDTQAFFELLQYKTGGYRDIQKGFGGVDYGGFVSDYTPIASFDVGIAGRASGVSVNITEAGGAAVNVKNVTIAGIVNIWRFIEGVSLVKIPNYDGIYGNNINNVPNIETGADFYDGATKDFKDVFDRAEKKLLDALIDISKNLTSAISAASCAISSTTCTDFNTAKNWVARRDPLVLDLDGGGIRTSAIDPNAPIYFDQNGDGIRTATGWIGAGEALVVRDLNGNGLIDSGRELFGDSTVLTHGATVGQTAANGFAALADLDRDANGVADGKFDSHDAAFDSVRLWQDANQDGISQAGELHTFAELGIASINVTGAAGSIDLGGGNTQTMSGSFTRSDGETGGSGTADVAGSLQLANNDFYRQFTDNPALTEAAQALPQMQGSGWVRDLRDAMSLGTEQALALQDMLIDDKWVNLSPGMNITAEIKTGRRRIIEYLMSPVQRAGSESLRDR